MTHYRNDGRARQKVVLVVLGLGDGFLHLSAHIFGLEAELLGYEVDGLGVQTLVDGHHDAHAHKGSDDLVDGDVHHVGKFAHGDIFRQLEHLALLALLKTLLIELLLHSLALLLAVFGALLVLVLLVGEPCERLLNLTCDVLLVHLDGLVVTVLVLLFLTGARLVVRRALRFLL